MLLPNCVLCNQLVMNTIAILCDIVGNLRPLSTTWACIYLRVYFTNVFYGSGFLTLPNCVHCTETLAPSCWILSVSCDHALLTTSACINLCVQLRTRLLRTRAIVNPIIMLLPNCTLSALRVTIDNLRQLWSTYFGLRLCSCLLSITFVSVKLHTLQ